MNFPKDHRTKIRGRLEMALCLVNACVRNSLEDLHAGIFPSSERGFSDVRVVSPYGQTPGTKWVESRMPR
jgi:hypothetical protein